MMATSINFILIPSSKKFQKSDQKHQRYVEICLKDKRSLKTALKQSNRHGCVILKHGNVDKKFLTSILNISREKNVYP